ncbi:unnamed protein product [Laminaria digitata]
MDIPCDRWTEGLGLIFALWVAPKSTRLMAYCVFKGFRKRKTAPIPGTYPLNLPMVRQEASYNSFPAPAQWDPPRSISPDSRYTSTYQMLAQPRCSSTWAPQGAKKTQITDDSKK